MLDLERIEALVAPLVGQLGYEVVQVEPVTFAGGAGLRISIDRLDADRKVSLGDCVTVTRALESVSELDDLFPGSYNLEVSSPGTERPLVRRKDYERFCGQRARVVFLVPVEGRRRLSGRIVSVGEEAIELDIGKKGDVVSIRLDWIEKANLEPDRKELFKRGVSHGSV